MTTITTTAPAAPALDPGDPGLRAEMNAVETEWPGWLLHLSEQGFIWCDFVSGVPSLRAPTPLEARRLIAEYEHAMELQYGTCDRPGCRHDHGSHYDGTGSCGFCGCGSFQLQGVDRMSEIKVKQGTELVIELPGLAAVRIDTQHRRIAIDSISGEARHDEPTAPEWTVVDLRDGTYGDFHRLLAVRYCGDSDCIAAGEHDRTRMVPAMTGTRGIGRRRTQRHEQVPVTIRATEKPTPTVVIPAVTPEPPALTEVITEGQEQAERGETADPGDFGPYEREPVPDLDSPDPADRTAYLRELGGDEFLFEATVADLNARWLLDTSLPPPPRTAPATAEDTKNADPGGAPPSGEGPAAATSSPAPPGPVSTEDEPVQDEAAEHDCGEDGRRGMSPDDWVPIITAVAIVLADIIIACGRRNHWLELGYEYGHADGAVEGHAIGLAEGEARGYARAQLDAVLATPSESVHFAEALLTGGLHEPVGEDMADLLDAVQEHERAARTEASR